jgi:3-isopropylmalate/(R)-2-methylmalate dehydratase large subunit
MQVRVEGALKLGVTAKDIALAVIGQIGTAGGTGYAMEFTGTAIRGLSMEGRMTLCNMAIEAGARAGMVAVDDKTLEYMRGRPYSPREGQFEMAAAYWRTLVSDPGAKFDAVVELDAANIKPQVTWGTSPEMVVPVDGRVPDPADAPNAVKKSDWERALAYMGLEPIRPSTRSTWTRCSSVPAPIPASRTCARRPGWRAGRWGRTVASPATSNWPWWYRVRGW